MSPLPTQVLPANRESIDQAARLILAGEVVAVPTETVYGLAADATNPKAVARIYEAKDRPSFNPLIVHVPSFEVASKIGEFNHDATMIARSYWPGPLTIVVPQRRGLGIASIVTAGLPTIAIRVPAHPVLQQLLMAVGRPLAAPSANASGSISPTRADHVLKSLGGRIPLILDGGATECGLESTILAANDGVVRLLRPGPVMFDKAVRDSSAGIEAPGQMESHYAPSKPVRLDAEEAEPDEYWIGFGALTGDFSLSRSGDTAEAATRLFDGLHRADESDRPKIAVAPIPDRGLGFAINDRLRRAATPR